MALPLLENPCLPETGNDPSNVRIITTFPKYSLIIHSLAVKQINLLLKVENY